LRKLLARLPLLRRLAGAASADNWTRPHPFDIAHGTDTSGFVSTSKLKRSTPRKVRAQSLPYAGSQPSIVRAALAALPRLDAFTFVDLGCGKGRPLLVAAEFPFRRLVGVELSASLADTARANAALIAPGAPLEIVTGDAGLFALPEGDVVVFLYNPFGDEVIAKVAAAVEAALARARRTIFVVYYNPVFGHRFDSAPSLRRHIARTFPYAPEELGFGPDTEDPVIVWHGGTQLGPAAPGADARIEIVDPLYRARLADT